MTQTFNAPYEFSFAMAQTASGDGECLYMAVARPMLDWSAAAASCRAAAVGAELASVLDESEARFVADLVKTVTRAPSPWWLGGFRTRFNNHGKRSFGEMK